MEGRKGKTETGALLRTARIEEENFGGTVFPAFPELPKRGRRQPPSLPDFQNKEGIGGEMEGQFLGEKKSGGKVGGVRVFGVGGVGEHKVHSAVWPGMFEKIKDITAVDVSGQACFPQVFVDALAGTPVGFNERGLQSASAEGFDAEPATAGE